MIVMIKMKNCPPAPHVSTIMVSAFHGKKKKKKAAVQAYPFLPVFKFVFVLGGVAAS